MRIPAAELHRRAVAAGDRGRHATARRLLRQALDRDPDPQLRAHVLLSLAYYDAERSGLHEGLRTLEEAAAVPGLSPRLQGLVASQRGLLHMRAGLPAEALSALGQALGLLRDDDAEDRARALLNRGVLHLQRGGRAEARADFEACSRLSRQAGLQLMAAKADHNLAYLSFLAGQLPQALRDLDAVAPQLGTQSAMFDAVYHADRAQFLLAAGLFAEADDDLEQATRMFQAARVPQGTAETLLLRAQVAVAQQRWATGHRLAGRARRRFQARGSTVWSLLAEQVGLAADVGRGQRLRAVAADAERLAGRLAEFDLPDDARRAALTAAEAALRLGEPALARSLGGPALQLRRGDPLRSRLQARAVRCDLALAEGRPGRARDELRAALADLHRYQATFGSLDLQTAVSAHGRPLAERALRQSLADGRPGEVLTWAERARALSARLLPVAPPADPVTATLLEDLRDLRLQLQGTDPGAPAHQQLRARCSRLERAIRQRSWYVPGRGDLLEPARLAQVRPRLAASGATVVMHLLSDGHLFALVVDARQARLERLGPAAATLELGRRVRADLDALAVVPPGPIYDSVLAAFHSEVQAIQRLVWNAVDLDSDDGPVVLAPSAELLTLPWTLLPALRARPVSVVPSVTAWLSSPAPSTTPSPTVVLAAGPGVPGAATEVGTLAALWRRGGSAPVVLPEATPSQVLRTAPSADVLHVAAHGVHAYSNPLFSRLDLHDGPLFGHDLVGSPALPRHIVLSACELGLAQTRAGGEALGMAAALLHSGAGSVVAGVARVRDETATRVAVLHHEGLCRGLPPATALAHAVDAAAAEGRPAPLVCFGAGW